MGAASIERSNRVGQEWQASQQPLGCNETSTAPLSARLALLRDTLIILGYQVSLRALLLARRWNY
jgi:hypothetical protein